MTNALSTRFSAQRVQPALLRRDRDWNNNKGARRGKLDITAEILMFCDEPKTKTSIMYNTNLNYAQLKRHMETLTTKQLLVKRTNKYLVTAKGREFLDLFLRLNHLVDCAPIT